MIEIDCQFLDLNECSHGFKAGMLYLRKLSATHSSQTEYALGDENMQ